MSAPLFHMRSENPPDVTGECRWAHACVGGYLRVCSGWGGWVLNGQSRRGWWHRPGNAQAQRWHRRQRTPSYVKPDYEASVHSRTAKHSTSRTTNGPPHTPPLSSGQTYTQVHTSPSGFFLCNTGPHQRAHALTHTYPHPHALTPTHMP